MAGVGEASAIVTLVGTAATLSKAVVDIASKYKNARKQIEFFGREVGVLGDVLDQLRRVHEKDHLEADDGVHSVTMTILNQCAELFAELDTYKDALYSRPGSVRGLTFRGKAKWVFTAAELDYLRARLESVKTNMLLMMAMQCMHDSNRSRDDRTIQELSSQSDGWAKRLETLQKEIMIPTDSSNDPAVNRMSINVIDTADSARSTRDSILSLYGHRSYYQIILDPREAPFAMALELQVDYARVSRIIEDHLEDDPQPAETASNAVDEALDIHAHGSISPAESSEESELDVHAQPSTKPVKESGDVEFWDLVNRYPCRARAIKSYSDVLSRPRFFFAKNEVLHVAAFSGTTWQVRKNTGEEGRAPSGYLTPHYPYRVRARFNFGHDILVLENEILSVSDKVEYYSRPDGWWSPAPQVWLPWRKMTGETGITPDTCFHCIETPLDKPLPPLPRPKPGEFNRTSYKSFFNDYTVNADDPINALSFTEMET